MKRDREEGETGSRESRGEREGEERESEREGEERGLRLPLINMLIVKCESCHFPPQRLFNFAQPATDTPAIYGRASQSIGRVFKLISTVNIDKVCVPG